MNYLADRLRRSHLDAWERWLPLWRAFFMTVVLGLTVAVVTEVPATAPQAFFLTALLLIWYGISLRWQGRAESARAPYLLAYQLGGWLVWFALTDLSPLYLFALFVLFPHLFMSLPLRWASVGAMLLMSLTLLRQVMLPNRGLDTWLILFSVTTIAGIILASFIEAIIKESTVRRDLILTLETTRRDLALAERQAGILQERQRLAAEIHDTIAQGLTGIITHLEVADAALQTDTAVTQAHLDQARQVARSSLTEVRRFIWGLRPAALEKQPLETAVQQLIEDWSASSGIASRWQVNGSRASLTADQETVLLRVVQEALANVAKHARARQVMVTLTYLPDMLVVDVKDDGCGFDLVASAARRSERGGYGLPAMRERLEKVGGNLTVESLPGEGTTIVAEIRLTEGFAHA